ncbi:MAG: aminotransferase class I/II-fold pyridoxal phosphate-dependent enzyme [Candidatus Dadabacteria bacterium]|nr:MAG: aminotransferase class I/II-fold pyridoxal phosphate-dependent enzyme [Candidatus Dadabacteria bacterium]
MSSAVRRDLTSPFELSPIKAIELKAATLPGVISLAQGIPSFNSPEVIREFVTEKIKKGLCDKYSLTNGLTELREEIAISLEDDGLIYSPDDEIIITAGSIEGITAALFACTAPGDEVLLPSPSYVSYRAAIRMAGCIPVFVELDEDNNFDFDVERLAGRISKKTRVVLFCNPNNPTGTLFSEDKIRELIALAAKHDLYIITDEVYKDFYYSDHKHFTPAAVPEARSRTVRVCSFSKAYAMTGWRVGFLHSDRDTVGRILKYHDAMVTCAPVASQYAAIAALKYGQECLQEFRREFQSRRDYTIEVLDSLSHVLDYQTPEAAYFVFPRLKGTIPLASDSRTLCERLLIDAGVAVVPGVAFGPSGESHLRITYGRSKEDLEEGLKRLAQYLTGQISRSRSSVAFKTDSSRTALIRMDGVIRNLAHGLLSFAARTYLWRAKPVIIGIVGSCGKTVYKRTLFNALKDSLNVRAGILSYNTRTGMPLSILNLVPPAKNKSLILFGLKVLLKAFFAKAQEDFLILEYGVRSVEDARLLCRIAVPDYLIVTGVTTGDPQLDCAQMANAVETLCEQVASGRIIWNQEDEYLKERLAKYSDSIGFRPSEVESGVAPIDKHGNFPVGQSARGAVLAAELIKIKLNDIYNSGNKNKTK